MTDGTFSATRLRIPLALEREGLGDASELALLDLTVGARLWPLLGVIELAYRTRFDEIAAQRHPRGAAWLFDVPVAQTIDARVARGANDLTLAGRDAVDAAIERTRRQLGRDLIERDEVVARLPLAFWIHVSTKGKHRGVPTLVGPPGWSIVEIWQLRARIAHHEPVLFLEKHVFDRGTGDPKTGLALIDSIAGAITTFLRRIERSAWAVGELAPEFAATIDPAVAATHADLAMLVDRLEVRGGELRLLRDERRARRR